jgi:hypothetical protein|tara:strand:- start:426 stop:638 length:213 start_codon:yes stop_codon:yes gene_type:complete
MKTQKLIKEYESKVLRIDESIAKIIELIRKGRKGDTSIDMDDLREEKANANSRRQIYIQFIADLKTLQDA